MSLILRLVLMLSALGLPLHTLAVDSVVLYTEEPPPDINLNDARKGVRQYTLPPCITCPDLSEVQQHLARLGYQPGPIDGIIGPRTRRAIRAFQSDEGMAVNGKVTERLLTTLQSR